MKKISLFLMLAMAITYVKSQSPVASTNITDPVNYIVKWSLLNSTQGKIIKSQLFDNGSSIGIGTTTPSWTLSFEGSSARTFGVDRTTLSSPGSSLTIQSGGGKSGYNNLNGGDLILKSGIATGTGVSNILFYTPQKTTTSGSTDRPFVERMRIDANGNVGIGTTNPLSGVHVVTTDKTAMFLEHTATSQWGYTFKISENTSDNNILGTTKVLSISKSAGGYQELFTVWGNGVVNAKSLYAEKVEVRTDAIGIYWPDYVFESNYTLPSLSSLKNYLSANKHLPDVPSASELNQNGLDVAKMDAVLLKKIEELTLYVIELQKQIDELKE